MRNNTENVVVVARATSFAERLRLGLAVIHGEPKGEMDEDGRNSPPPQEAEPPREEDMNEDPLNMSTDDQQQAHLTMNILPVMPKEKPPLNVVGDVHGRVAIIVVREGGREGGREGERGRGRGREREREREREGPVSVPGQTSSGVTANSRMM